MWLRSNKTNIDSFWVWVCFGDGLSIVTSSASILGMVLLTFEHGTHLNLGVGWEQTKLLMSLGGDFLEEYQ